MEKILEHHLSGENIPVNSELFSCVSNHESEQHSYVQNTRIEGSTNDPLPINEAQLSEEHANKVLQNEMVTDNKSQFIVKDGSVDVDKCNLYVTTELESSFLCEEMYMLDEESGERRTVIRYINQNDKDLSDDHFGRENISNEPSSAEFINCCASDIDSSYGVSETQRSILPETSSNICIIESTTSLCDDIATQQCSEKDPLTIEEQLVLLSNECHEKSETKVDSSDPQGVSIINDVPVTTTYIKTDLAHKVPNELNRSNKSTTQCERDLNNFTSFSSDDKMTDYKSVAENLFKTCSEVEKILKSIGQDDNFDKSSPYSNNSEQRNEMLVDDNVVYKCGLCSFVDKSIEKLAVHIHSCGLKRKSSQGSGEGASKKHQVPVPIAPKCDLPSGLPISSNPQYIIAPCNKISASPKIKVALTSQARVSSSTTHVHSQFTAAETKLVSSSTLSSSNTHYVITSQPSVSFAQNTAHNVSKPQVPIIPSTPLAISQSQIPVIPSAQLAVTSQGQLTLAQPGTQLLITTKPPFHNTVSGRQPTLLGVGIGTNPSLAAKNIVLLPNLILNSPTTVSSQQNGTKPNISLQPPIVLQNSMPINSIASMPFQQSVLFTPPALSNQPQVLLSPIYLSDGSVSNENSIANMTQFHTVTQPSTKKQINTSKSSSAKKQDRSHVTNKSTKSSNKPTYICEICDDYLADLVKLKNHMKCLHEIRIHPKMMPCFNCQKCQYCFFTEQGLGRHLVGSHGLVTASMQEAADQGKDGGRCPICGWGYQSKILEHIASDHKVSLKSTDLSYKCTLCTSKFEVYKQFEKHVYSAHRADLSKMSKLRRK